MTQSQSGLHLYVGRKERIVIRGADKELASLLVSRAVTLNLWVATPLGVERPLHRGHIRYQILHYDSKLANKNTVMKWKQK